MTTKKTPPQRKEKFRQSLKCTLTTDEKLAIATEMADSQKQAQNLQTEMDEYKKQMKSKIDQAVSRTEELGDQLRTGYEFRTVECQRVYDWKKKTVVEVRHDTKKQFANRKMTDDELQMEMDMGDGDNE